MKNNIYFFQVNFEIGYGKFKTHWLPYAVAKIWSNAKTHKDIDRAWQAQDFIFQRLPIDKLSKYIVDPTVVAFSCYIWNWNYNLQAAKKIKELYPNCTIVFGGPQVTDDPLRLSEFYQTHSYVDYTFHGEAEISFVDFLRYLNNETENLPKGITCYGYYKNTTGERVNDLAALASPFIDGTMDSIVAKHKDKNFSITLETNRGCPYACTFCDWGSLTFNKIKNFPVEIVKQEIEWISCNGIKFVDVSDANFGIMKDRDFDILKYMIKLKNQYGYPESYSFNWQKNSTDNTLEMVEFLTNNNSARGFTLSTQSMSDDVLTKIKRKNLGINNFKELLNKCNINNIQTYTELILGLPGETALSWKEGKARLLAAGQHNNIEIWLCQLLENAELNSRQSLSDYKIESVPIRNYISGEHSEDIIEGINIIKATETMTHDELIECYLYSWMITNFHSFGWTQIISRWLNVTQGVDFQQFYDDLFEYIYIDKFFRELLYQVEENIREAFDIGLVKGSGLHYYIAEYQKILHYNREQVFRQIAVFLEDYKYEVSNDVFKFTEHFITYYDCESVKTVELETPIWEIINNLTSYAYSGKYQFYMNDNPKDKNEYYDSFYFRRRKGWGKYNVKIIA